MRDRSVSASCEDLKCFEFRIWSMFLLAGLTRALRCDAARVKTIRGALWYQLGKASKVSGPDHRAGAGWTSAGEGVVVDRCGELSL